MEMNLPLTLNENRFFYKLFLFTKRFVEFNRDSEAALKNAALNITFNNIDSQIFIKF